LLAGIVLAPRAGVQQMIISIGMTSSTNSLVFILPP
jgi:hypothetical protein